MRICNECKKKVVQGYCIDNGMEYYCSDECLHKHYTEEELNAAVCKILIASLMAPANAVKNLENWVATQMEKKFDTIFGESKKEDFEAWALGHILCIIECFLLKGKVNDANVSEAASDIYDVLAEFKSNPYIESYKDILLTEFILNE